MLKVSAKEEETILPEPMIVSNSKAYKLRMVEGSIRERTLNMESLLEKKKESSKRRRIPEIPN